MDTFKRNDCHAAIVINERVNLRQLYIINISLFVYLILYVKRTVLIKYRHILFIVVFPVSKLFDLFESSAIKTCISHSRQSFSIIELRY